MRECTHCHAQMNDDDAFCNICGKSLDAEPAREPKSAAVPGSPPVAAPPSEPPAPVPAAGGAVPMAVAPGTPPRRSRAGLIIGIAVAAVVLLGCCAAGGLLLLGGGEVPFDIGLSIPETPDGYSLAYSETYDEATWGPWDTEQTIAWIVEPASGGSDADDVVYAVVIWFRGPTRSYDELFDEWWFPDDLDDRMTDMTPDREWDAEGMSDFAIDGDVAPEEDLAVYVEVLLTEDTPLSEEERETVAGRLTRWAMENPPD